MATSIIKKPLRTFFTNLAGGVSATVTASQCMVVMSRGAASATATVALHDSWGVFTYLAKNASMVVEHIDGTTIKLTNNLNQACSCAVIPFA